LWETGRSAGSADLGSQPDPNVLLLDEPLSNLVARLRADLREEMSASARMSREHCIAFPIT
jgi:ABC-type Fe3+/spermidine/putrescine transport system ATPase subunit